MNIVLDELGLRPILGVVYSIVIRAVSNSFYRCPSSLITFLNCFCFILIGETDSLGSGSHAPAPVVHHGIEQLAINMGFGGVKPSIAHPSSLSSIPTTTSTQSSVSSLDNSSNFVFQPVSTPSSSEVHFELNDQSSLYRGISHDTETEVQERVITKIDAEDLTAKPTVIAVPKDPTRRAAMLLAGPKFELNSSKIPLEKLPINTDIIYSVAVS